MLALSTAWFKESPWSLDDIFARLTEHGFRAFELNYVVHPLNLNQLDALMERTGFEITSLHNVCSSASFPPGQDDRYGDNIASLDEEERRQGASYLRSTAETAMHLGARAIVIHAGSVPAARKDSTYFKLREAYLAGEIAQDAMHQEMQVRYAQRKKSGRPHLEQLLKSLAAVCPDFPTLRFGLESRYHFYSLPDIDELDYVLDRLSLDNVGYWHDCGHAQVQENLGLCRHEDWLQRYGDRLIGVHLHGMGDLIHDHFAPAAGNMPFEMIGRYLNDDTVRVLELANFNDLDSIIAGRDYLEDLYTAETLQETTT